MRTRSIDFASGPVIFHPQRISVMTAKTFPGITNYEVPIPGSDVTAYLAHHDGTSKWTYSLWAGTGDDESVISTGQIDFEGMPVTPDQVSRVAFTLDVEYAS